MRNTLNSLLAFIREVWRGGWTIAVSVLVPLASFLTWVRDEFFLRYSNDQHKILNLLPRWPLIYWVNIFLCVILLLSFRAGARIWQENKTLKDDSLKDAPQLLLNYLFEGHVGWAFVLSNDGSATAVNIEPQKIAFMKSMITFRPVASLSSKAKIPLHANIDLVSLLKDAWIQERQTVEVAVSVNFEDVRKRKYESSWQISCRDVVSKGTLFPERPVFDIKFLGCKLAP